MTMMMMMTTMNKPPQDKKLWDPSLAVGRNWYPNVISEKNVFIKDYKARLSFREY